MNFMHKFIDYADISEPMSKIKSYQKGDNQKDGPLNRYTYIYYLT